ncbi:hypothetical protein [Halomonas sp. RA08-2]|uniref:hypothetical protein n=1 Tax=Halomonas sp. RA08-2 TaxID=3440842 RepID=UPI003EED51D4
MKLTRRQLLRSGLLLGSAAPLTMAAAWAGQASPGGAPVHSAIRLYGVDRSTTDLGLGLRQQGWEPRYEGRLDPLALNTLPAETLITGFTDEAGLVLLTSLLAGRGRILALGRHEQGRHRLLSHRGPVAEPLSFSGGSWQSALGREYARLALAGDTGREVRQFRRPADAGDIAIRELSFLVRV